MIICIPVAILVLRPTQNYLNAVLLYILSDFLLLIDFKVYLVTCLSTNTVMSWGHIIPTSLSLKIRVHNSYQKETVHKVICMLIVQSKHWLLKIWCAYSKYFEALIFRFHKIFPSLQKYTKLLIDITPGHKKSGTWVHAW